MSNPLEKTPLDRLEMMRDNARIRLSQTAEWLEILEREIERREGTVIEPKELKIEHKRRGW